MNEEARVVGDGGELIYRNSDAMMAVTVETEPAFSAGIPSVLFRIEYTGGAPRYSVSPNGQRFLMMQNADTLPERASEPTALFVVENWFEELNRLAPPSP